MRIGLNALSLVPGHVGGGETYIRNLVGALARIDSRNEYLVFVNQSCDDLIPDSPNMKVVSCRVNGHAKIARTLYDQTVLPAKAARMGVKLLHGLGAVIPSRMGGMKMVVTVHDVIFRKFPNEFAPLQRAVATLLISRSARLADAVITDCEFSRHDIAETFKVPAEKIVSVPLGYGSFPDKPEEVHAYFESQDLPYPYIYTASSTYYHKNLERLLEAFAILKSRTKLSHKLIISGLRMAAHDVFHEKIEALKLERSVVFTGWVSPAVMRGLYTRADLFVFPSLYEGFGLPVLEAMSLGTPVACSNVTSLPEIAGDAAAYFDPQEPGAIADTLIQLLESENRRKDLSSRGKLQAVKFSWEQCAQGTLDVYRRLGAL